MNKVQYFVCKQGVLALAHPTSDATYLWLCTLKILYVELGAHFTVSLDSDVLIQGINN
jgi:hypothetical protein